MNSDIFLNFVEIFSSSIEVLTRDFDFLCNVSEEGISFETSFFEFWNVPREDFSENSRSFITMKENIKS